MPLTAFPPARLLLLLLLVLVAVRPGKMRSFSGFDLVLDVVCASVCGLVVRVGKKRANFGAGMWAS